MINREGCLRRSGLLTYQLLFYRLSSGGGKRAWGEGVSHGFRNDKHQSENKGINPVVANKSESCNVTKLENSLSNGKIGVLSALGDLLLSQDLFCCILQLVDSRVVN